MIDKLIDISEEKRKHFYRKLTSRLLEVFGQGWYDDEESLQISFHEWKNSDRKGYHSTLDDILQDISPQGFKLTWRDMKKLNYKRFKLCKVCLTPYISYDKKNRSIYCYSTDYTLYKVVGSGKYFKASEQGKSNCYIIDQSAKRRKSNKNNIVYVKSF